MKKYCLAIALVALLALVGCAEHEHSWDSGVVTKPATCTEKGEMTYTCLVCEVTRTEEIDATGHKWDDGAVTTNPSCTDAGVKTFTCTVCDETKAEKIPATGHSYVWTVVKNPDCVNDGSEEEVCSKCDAKGNTRVVAALDHAFGSDDKCTREGCNAKETSAARIGTNYFDTLTDAINGAPEDATVILLKDITGNVDINGKKNITIDFNGHVVSGGVGIGCIYDDYWSDAEPSSVVFIDSGENGGVTTSESYAALRIMNGSEVSIEGGCFASECDKSYSRVIRLEDSVLMVTGGIVKNCSTGSYSRAIEVGRGTGKVTINGGEFSTVSSYGVIVYGDSSAAVELTVNDGKFNTSGLYGWFTNLYGKITINDCRFTSAWNQVFDPETKTGSYDLTNNISVKGGTFTLGNLGNPDLGGFVYCNKTLDNAYGYVSGMLDLSGGRINFDMHKLILEDSNCSATLDADGYYSIVKKN